MTPKEKAQELFNNILEKMPHPDVTNANVYLISKQCALISVDEILLSNPIIFREDNSIMLNKSYWQEVKQEIENL